VLVTVLAIVLVVTLGFHVLVGILLPVEFLRTRFTLDFRCPVTGAIHMLVGGISRREVLGASLTVESRGPVIGAVHVLVASSPAPKGTSTGLTLGPVVVLIHVIIAISLAPAVVRTGETLVIVHPAKRRLLYWWYSVVAGSYVVGVEVVVGEVQSCRNTE
jgi:hypothetical protein